MQTERGWLIGPGDKALAVSAAGAVSFDRNELTDADLLEASPISGDAYGRAVVRPVPYPQFIVGADATGFNPTGNPALEYYAKAADPGFYEMWAFGVWADGVVTAEVIYKEQGANHGRPFHAAGLTWVKQG